ncbi:protein kinase [Streptomyces sp. 3MP-14]|uniref:Protein kinase n=1 Tax=Streptomyces mimosae TaxID=2586635 RepID=A0A5N6AIZ6_9ACTN|nr:MULTISPECIES: serine/threonine-protein kinase [Streptomyces]KAB8167729.1 protein kinase [Streptomyces mimosae]KAB8177624.1 protein kinase [Streptomyces sp. 3MP-14]
MEALAEDDPREVGGYRLLGRLGAGGMGQVYLGRSNAGRHVALKRIHPWLVAVPGFRDRFAREIRASTLLTGPGTVRVVAADAEAASPWLATAYLPSPTLGDVLTEHGPLPEPAVWRLLAGLAGALAEVHGHQLIHRDLKPSNVLLPQSGPLLIDFGIARAVDETGQTGTGLAVGSAGYMAPEQATGKRVASAADVFSLGALLVHAATGRPPFGVGSAPELLYRVVHEEPDLTGLSPELARVTRECLAKKPGERPSLQRLTAEAARHDTAGRDWLPGAVSAEIARRAEELLRLPYHDEEPQPGRNATAAASAASEAPTAVVPPRPSHPPTRVDAAAAARAPWWEPARGAMAATARGLAGWGRKQADRRRQRADRGRRTAPPGEPGTASATPAPPKRARPVGHLAPWVKDKGLGRLAFSLWGLLPMMALPAFAPQLRTVIDDYPQHPDDRNFGNLTEWAQETDWFLSLPLALFVALLALSYARPRLTRYTERTVRIWVGLTAGYWLLWSGLAALCLVWFVGMDDGWELGELPELPPVFTGFDILLALLLLGCGLAAPFVAFTAASRLNRASLRDLGRDGTTPAGRKG